MGQRGGRREWRGKEEGGGRGNRANRKEGGGGGHAKRRGRRAGEKRKDTLGLITVVVGFMAPPYYKRQQPFLAIRKVIYIFACIKVPHPLTRFLAP